jgi:hypothetical protein
MSQITATLVVNFSGTGGGGDLMLEVDSDPAGLNEGRTTFKPGEAPGFLLYKSDNVVVDILRCTEGGISEHGQRVETVREFLTCAGDRKVTTSKPVNGGFSILGSWGDAYTYSLSNSEITFDSEKLLVLEVSYTTTAKQYRVNGASGVAPIVVLAIGHTGES